MRYIPLLEKTPPQEWCDKALRAQAEIDEEAKKGIKERNEKIDTKGYIWGELKDWLLTLSIGKCWFSEARELFEYWDVEHYRPKKSAKDLSGNQRDGYWWLSLDWKNYRVCGRKTNTKKGTFFPVYDICADETHRARVDDELPYLLDPTNEHDCDLLSFDSSGNAIPMSGVEGWEKERVTVSVERYQLDFPNLVDYRKTLWETCDSINNKIQNLMLEYQKNPSATKKAEYESEIKKLLTYTNRDQICSSVAIAYLLKSDTPVARQLAKRVGR